MARGNDGRYYLYYSIEESSVISVAVCDTPAGKYQFYGHVRNEEGHILGSAEEDPFQFDPAVLVEENHIYLYSGQNIPVAGVEEGRSIGTIVCELEPDMVTTKTKQTVLSSGTVNRFEENPFFEASSVRKFQGKYYFIYSPLPNVHNLCYAVSDYPDKEFHYRGVLVSNADIIDHEEGAFTFNYWGNNHGSIEYVNGEYFVFYHRQTNKSGWCRQACAEPIKMNKDGSFIQAKMTSSGLSRQGVKALGKHGCYTACHLYKKDMIQFIPFQFLEFDDMDPYFTQEDKTELQYIANMKNGSIADYRFFEFTGEERKITVTCRGIGVVGYR